MFCWHIFAIPTKGKIIQFRLSASLNLKSVLVSNLKSTTILGRVTGISSILWGAIQAKSGSASKDLQAMQGLRTLCNRKSAQDGAGVVIRAGEESIVYPRSALDALLAGRVFNIWPESAPATNILLTIVAGLLVGFGTKLGSGCTSGHGVCAMFGFLADL